MPSRESSPLERDARRHAGGMTKLTVVLPTLNEAENLERMVGQLLALDLSGAELDVLIADNDSPDGTGEIGESLADRHSGRVAVLHLGGVGGLGAAYVRAFTHALAMGSELIVQMDCDFSHPADVIPRMLRMIRSTRARPDMVLGSRYAPGGGTTQEWPWARQLLSTFANSIYVRTALGIPLADATGGYRMWRRETLLGMDFAKRIRSDGYIFQVEMAYIAWKLGYRVTETPILFAERAAGESKMSLKIQAEAAWRVFQVRRNHGALTPQDRALGYAPASERGAAASTASAGLEHAGPSAHAATNGHATSNGHAETNGQPAQHAALAASSGRGAKRNPAQSDIVRPVTSTRRTSRGRSPHEPSRRTT